MVMVIFPKMEDGDFSSEVVPHEKLCQMVRSMCFSVTILRMASMTPHPQKGLFGEALSHLLYLGTMKLC